MRDTDARDPRHVATDDDGAPPVGEQGFANKLRRLFEYARDADGIAYTAKRIAERANELGYPLSDAYISQLRTGKARTPSFRTVEAIAHAFGVSVTYFLTRPEFDGTRARHHDDIIEILSTGTHWSRADVASLCPTTIDVVIDVLNVLRAQAVEQHRPAADSALQARVRVQARDHQVDDEQVEHQRHESGHIDPGGGRVTPAGGGAGVQVRRVDHPGDE